MPRRRRPFCGTLVLLLAFAPLRAHEEWNNLHIGYSASTDFVYPFDGRSPKIAVALLNHHETPTPAVTYTLSINGQRQTSQAFATFPDDSPIIVAPNEYSLASTPSSGILDGRAGLAPAVGETKSYTFDFVFSLVDPATAIFDPDGDQTETYTQSQEVHFTNLGDNPTLAGPLPCAGLLHFPAISGSPPVANARVEVSTPYSNWFPLPLTPTPSGTGPTFSFSQSLPERNDWYVRLSADGYETRVIALGFFSDPHPDFNVTLAPAAPLDFDYRRVAAIATPTGFWRGSVSESEGTFVAFPGQENWKPVQTDAEVGALRSGGRIYKYKFDGTKLWEHVPGWETWAGDMTPDGHFVAYALNPTAQPFRTPSENKLVLLDGATGAVIWTKSAAPSGSDVGRKLDSLELALSPDARWIAVGSTAGGAVTLVDRQSGNFIWTVPGAGASTFGQIRKLRFSPDSQFLYCGSGDSQLRKLRTSDGAVMWKVFAGGWPWINGIDLTPDGAWLAAGTNSLDGAVVRTSDGFVQWQKETQYSDAVFAPDGRHLATAGGQIFRTFDGLLAGMTKTPALTRFTPDGRSVLQFDREFRLHDLGGKLLKTFEASGLGDVAGEQPQWAHFTRDGRYAIMLGRDMTHPPQTGIVIYERQAASVSATPPTIIAQPLAQTVEAGSGATLAVTASGTAPLGFQWRKNGTDLQAQTSPVLALPGVAQSDAAVYTCVVTNAAGSANTIPAALAIVTRDTTNPTRLANLAVSANVGATALAVGFTVGGADTSGPKPLLLRAAGPSLIPFGVHGVLPDPRIVLFNGGDVVMANDNWAGDPQILALAARLGAFPFAGATTKDAALAVTASGGGYSAQVASADGSPGIVIAEIYDGSPSFAAGTPRLINLSAGGRVNGATEVLVAGFVIDGPAAKTVLVRAIGPSLSPYGVTNLLADPQLTLFSDTTPLATNDNWYDTPNSVAVAASSIQVGAFSLPPTSRDSALLLSLPPGKYSAQVSGAAGTSGNALVEVYEVP